MGGPAQTARELPTFLQLKCQRAKAVFKGRLRVAERQLDQSLMNPSAMGSWRKSCRIVGSFGFKWVQMGSFGYELRGFGDEPIWRETPKTKDQTPTKLQTPTFDLGRSAMRERRPKFQCPKSKFQGGGCWFKMSSEGLDRGLVNLRRTPSPSPSPSRERVFLVPAF